MARTLPGDGDGGQVFATFKCATANVSDVIRDGVITCTTSWRVGKNRRLILVEQDAIRPRREAHCH